MSDDIVDDLRRFAGVADITPIMLRSGDILTVAADEIDKLRSLVRALRRELEATRAPNPHRPIERAVQNVTVKLDPTAPTRPFKRWRDL